MGKIDLSISELTATNNNLQTTLDDLTATLGKMNTLVGEIRQNYVGSDVERDIAEGESLIDATSKKLVAALPGITSFIKKQIDRNIANTEVATAKLTILLQKMEELASEVGVVVPQTVATVSTQGAAGGGSYQDRINQTAKDKFAQAWSKEAWSTTLNSDGLISGIWNGVFDGVQAIGDTIVTSLDWTVSSIFGEGLLGWLC